MLQSTVFLKERSYCYFYIFTHRNRCNEYEYSLEIATVSNYSIYSHSVMTTATVVVSTTATAFTITQSGTCRSYE